MATAPGYQDADLLLRVYDMRRESRIRRARDFVLGKVAYADYAEFKKKYPPDSNGRRQMGMVFTYWDMVCALIDRGLLNEELFNSCNTEHVYLWLKFRTAIAGMREDYQFPDLLRSLEKVAMRHPIFARMDEWMQQQQRGARGSRRQPRSKAAKAGR